MSMKLLLKNRVESLPEGIARHLARIPYSVRLGSQYVSAYHRLQSSDPVRSFCGDQLIARLRRLVEHAADKVPFYRQLYKEFGVKAGDIRSWSDWACVPIVTKAMLQSVPISERTTPSPSGLLLNTGGSAGQPLQFMVDDQAFAREWAHMHHAWSARGYRPRHLKLTLRGKRFADGRPLRYNAVHNELIANANLPATAIVEAVLARSKHEPIRWIHGYPSLIAEFAAASEQVTERHEFCRFRSQLYGALLGSEFPIPAYRSVIEGVLTSNTVSWYGHSEMALLARETSLGVYQSYPTYGYAESAPTGGEQHKLVCTSLHNHVHPFIRYDTGDLVEPIPGPLNMLAFRVSEGRSGDFIRDRKGRRHALTAVIFGRHHAAFNLIRHLQVRDDGDGVITLIITPKTGIDVSTVWQGLDLGDLDIEWHIELVESPIRTPAGKIKLKIS